MINGASRLLGGSSRLFSIHNCWNLAKQRKFAFKSTKMHYDKRKKLHYDKREKLHYDKREKLHYDKRSFKVAGGG